MSVLPPQPSSYIDRVYGLVPLPEQVLIDLIASAPMQRLKRVSQEGYFHPWMPGQGISRFEHSLGVMALLQRYHAPLEEQVAGLLHDVSHSAFSHCIDYILADGNAAEQSHQDRSHAAFVGASIIPEILAWHDFDTLSILDDRRFPLKEQPLPDLCADRIDYSLREALAYREITPADAHYFLSHLSVEDSHWVFTDQKTARAYAELYRTMNSSYWAGLPTALMFKTVGDYFRHALQQRYITYDDLYTTDDDVLERVATHHSHDPQLRLLFARMNCKIPYITTPSPRATRIVNKSRAVDPRVIHEGMIRPLSALDPEWRPILERESRPKEYFLEFDL